jgi:hypothetical protein
MTSKAAGIAPVGGNGLARGDALEAGAHDEDLPQVSRVDLHQPHAAVGRVRHDALTLQQPQRFPHGDAADVEPARDLRLDQPLARQDSALRGGAHERLDDLFDERDRANGADKPQPRLNPDRAASAARPRGRHPLRRDW